MTARAICHFEKLANLNKINKTILLERNTALTVIYTIAPYTFFMNYIFHSNASIVDFSIFEI